ncbi:MAG: LLM class flavin-dependent oxidoreductase [Ktedonobacteraceae bacterium]|nr:LLM class flavin-dependent oxidoreductase [Ktedonobacteraceae bacterium]
MVTLGVLDQLPVFRGSTPSQVIQESILLAQSVEDLGYQRFWVAEHHSSGMACASPEILVAAIAAQTKHIRVGSGGVMLPHYSALKVAESFRMLQALFPGRIDIGIGRGLGASPLTRQVLNPREKVDDETYTQQIEDLIGFLHNNFPSDHSYQKIRAMPDGPGAPAFWLLGAGAFGVKIAARLGLSFSFAQFIRPTTEPEILQTYRQTFQPGSFEDKPRAMVTVRVVCAETEEQAQRLARNFWVVNVQRTKESPLSIFKQAGRLPAGEEVEQYHMTGEDEEFMQKNELMMIAGTPTQVKQRLLQLAADYQAEELMILTYIPDFQARLRSYELLAEAFALTPAPALVK